MKQPFIGLNEAELKAVWQELAKVYFHNDNKVVMEVLSDILLSIKKYGSFAVVTIEQEQFMTASWL